MPGLYLIEHNPCTALERDRPTPGLLEEVEMSVLIYIVVALVLVTFVALSLTGLQERR